MDETLKNSLNGKRIGAVDYGKKRLGLAVCDELHISITYFPCGFVNNLAQNVATPYILDKGIPVFLFSFLIADSEIYRLCSNYLRHTSCPLPSAILKAIEVELELAVPRDVKMKIEK